MLSFKEFLIESAAKSSYSDEHAHAHVWNHMVQKGIGHDLNGMHEELNQAKTDSLHPLHHSNAPSKGFKGAMKTAGSVSDYHKELLNATHTVHALAMHPDFKTAVKEKHVAKVAGASTNKVSALWKKHGASQGTSKADVTIHKEGSNEGAGIRLSMKKGGGSQLMSAGPEENKAVHDHAARKMLDTHPNYSKHTEEQKNQIHATIMKHMDDVHRHIYKMRTEPANHDTLKKNAQASLDTVHKEHPQLNSFVRHEATSGEGKFGKDSHAAASHIVKTATATTPVSIHHVDTLDHSGSLPRAAKPKGRGRSGNIKADY